MVQHLKESWRRHAALFLAWYGVVVVMCLVAVALGIRAGEPLLFYIDIQHEGRFFGMGYMTALSGLWLGLAGGFLGVTGWARGGRSFEPSIARGWAVAGAGCFVLGFDEIASLHEFISKFMDRQGIPRIGGWVDHDIFVWAAYAVAAIIIIWSLRSETFAMRRAGIPAILALVCYGGSQVLDQIPWDSMQGTTQMVVGCSEEVIKTLGSASILLFAMLTMGAVLSAQSLDPERDT